MNKWVCHSSKAYFKPDNFSYGSVRFKYSNNIDYGYLGKIPINKFITLGQFRELRMKNILDD